MNCPKDKEQALEEIEIAGGLPVMNCRECGGVWLNAGDYAKWREGQPQSDIAEMEELDVKFKPSPNDPQGALCPCCGCYMARARVGIENTFYIERCGTCGGIWCDGGEWDVLKQLGLNVMMQDLFSYNWTALLRERESAERQWQQMEERLGPELAGQVLDLASLLEEHPEREFALAYLIRVLGRSG